MCIHTNWGTSVKVADTVVEHVAGSLVCQNKSLSYYKTHYTCYYIYIPVMNAIVQLGPEASVHAVVAWFPRSIEVGVAV